MTRFVLLRSPWPERNPKMLKTSLRLFVPACLLMSFLLPLLGCGGGKSLSCVSGEVMFDGKPVQTGLIVFELVQGKVPPPGVLIKNGKYEVTAERKLAPGSYLVRITAPDLSKSDVSVPAGLNDPAPQAFPLLPLTWNTQSQLKVELKPGNNAVNFSGNHTEPPQVEMK